MLQAVGDHAQGLGVWVGCLYRVVVCRNLRRRRQNKSDPLWLKLAWACLWHTPIKWQWWWNHCCKQITLRISKMSSKKQEYQCLKQEFWNFSNRWTIFWKWHKTKLKWFVLCCINSIKISLTRMLFWFWYWGSNLRPCACQGGACAVELNPRPKDAYFEGKLACIRSGMFVKTNNQL